MFEALIDSLEQAVLEMKKIQEDMNIASKEETSPSLKTVIRPVTIIIPMNEGIEEEGTEKSEEVIDKNKNPIQYMENRIDQALGKIKWQ
jgi:hypothetical protein